MMEWAGRALNWSAGIESWRLWKHCVQLGRLMLLGAKRSSSLKHRLRGAGVSEQLIGDNRSPAVLSQTKQSFGLDLGLRECELWIKEQTPEYG